jgi:magnesium-transporting ATPase (P-type)
LGIADALRPEAAEAVAAMADAGLEDWMVTGDNGRTAMAIGEQVGIRFDPMRRFTGLPTAATPEVPRRVAINEVAG